jgi:Domain of unknown function (DUF4282)
MAFGGVATNERAETMGVLSALFDFSFVEFLTSKLVKFMYALSVIGVALVYIVTVLTGFSQGAGQGLLLLVAGGIVALLTLAYVRVLLEFVMVLFRIYDNTHTIARQGLVQTAVPPAQPAAPPAGTDGVNPSDQTIAQQSYSSHH